MTEDPKIAVLMACHNRKEKTLRCLTALMPQLGDGDCVFLVDDGSTDGTEDEVRKLFTGKVKMLKGNGSLYWAKGMRKAWDSAIASGVKFDFFLWLNDDLILKPNAIEATLSDWKKCKDARSVVVGSCSSDESESECSYGVTDSDDRLIKPNLRRPQIANGWLNGNFVLVPYAAYEIVGEISGDYSHGKADYDYAERLKIAKIPFCCASNYVGVCEPNTKAERCFDKNLFGRMSLLWSPSLFNLHDLWTYRCRFYSVGRAIVSCLHLICIVIRGG